MDAIIGLKIVVGEIEPTLAQSTLADVTRNGVVEVTDIVVMLQDIVRIAEIQGCGVA